MKMKTKMKKKMKRTKMRMQEIKKNSTDTKKDENKNILLELIEDVDEKPFKKYSRGKTFNSFINEFHSATNKEDKEKVVNN